MIFWGRFLDAESVQSCGHLEVAMVLSQESIL